MNLNWNPRENLYELRTIQTFVFIPDYHRILMEWFGLEETLKSIQFQTLPLFYLIISGASFNK